MQSAKGLTSTGRSASKATHLPVDRRPQFLDTQRPGCRLLECHNMAAGFPRLEPRINRKDLAGRCMPFMTYLLKSLRSVLLYLLDRKESLRPVPHRRGE